MCVCAGTGHEELTRAVHMQVLQLDEGVRAARAMSAVELMGRKMLQDGDDQAADPVMTPADPAARILEALLAEPDQAARFALLPEAFTPSEPSGEAVQVSTACGHLVMLGFSVPAHTAAGKEALAGQRLDWIAALFGCAGCGRRRRAAFHIPHPAHPGWAP